MKLELVLDEGPLPWRPTDEWIRRAEAMLEHVGTPEPVVQFVLTDDATLHEHNRDYRGKDAPTDVLSFSYLEDHEDDADALVDGEVSALDYLDEPVLEDEPPLVGQVLVSLETLIARGPVHGADLDAEVAFMLAHGVLHVLGHDHADDDGASRMQDHERELMARGGFVLSAARTGGAGS